MRRFLTIVGGSVQRFAGWLFTGEGKEAVALKYLIRLGCQNQRLTVYSFYYQLPFAYCTGQTTCKPPYRCLQVGCPVQ